MERKFKILVYEGMYVNTSLLESGIYTTDKPVLYSRNETIESLIKKSNEIKDKMGISFMSESYFENLQQCELVDVEILVKVNK